MRSPAAAQLRAVQAATEVLPTPPLPVYRIVRGLIFSASLGIARADRHTRSRRDRSRATAKGRRTRYIIYHAHHITSFELKAYYRGRLALRVYRSDHGHRWYPVGLESTEPAPALEGDGWCLVDLLARGALSADTHALKIELASRRVELSQVAIAYR